MCHLFDLCAKERSSKRAKIGGEGRKERKAEKTREEKGRGEKEKIKKNTEKIRQ